MKGNSTVQQKENIEEGYVRVLERLLGVNFKILEIIDMRLTELEDQVELLEKKKGN